MADKLIYIPNDDVTRNYPSFGLHLLKHLDIQPNEPTNQTKVVKQMNKKTLL